MKIINNNFSLLGTNCKFNAIPFKNNCVNCGAPRIEIGRFIMGTNNFCVRIMCVHIIKYRAFVFSGFSLPWKKQICVEYQYKCNSCCDNYYSSKKKSGALFGCEALESIPGFHTRICCKPFSL